MSNRTPEQEVIRLKEQLDKLYGILGWNPDQEPVEMSDMVLCIRDLRFAIDRKDEVLATAYKALETAQNGLHWYQDNYPQVVTDCDHEANVEIAAAIDSIKVELRSPKCE